MTRNKRLLVSGLVGLSALGLLSLIFLGPGCVRQPGNTGGPGGKPPNRGEHLTAAVKLMREGGEIQHYQNGLSVVNDYLSSAPPEEGNPVRKLPKVEADALQARFGLEKAQLDYLRQEHFDKGQDAYHLDSAFLFRDAARSAASAVLPKSQQVQDVLGWVSREVLLHEQGEPDLPPAFILRQGFGGVRDRALVFLGLLRQIDMEGCLVSAEEAEGPTKPLLVGVLVPLEKPEGKEEKDKKEPGPGLKESKAELEVALYDLRLGRAVAGPAGKGVATLRQAVGQPELLKPYGFPAEKEKWNLYLASPLGALAPRMQFLEEPLAAHGRINLFQDVVRLVHDLEHASEQMGEENPVVKVASWEAPGKEKASPAPVHLLARFLAAAEKAPAQRLKRFEFERLAWPEIFRQLKEMRLSPESLDIPLAAGRRLQEKIYEVFDKFLIQPRNMLLHGRPSDALKRLNRIMQALEDFEAIDPGREAKFSKEVSAWRGQLEKVYAALARKEKGAEGQEAFLWAEDQYLNVLLDVEGDTQKPDRTQRKILTAILVRACKEPLSREVRFLEARCLLEEAEARQAVLAREGAGKDAARGAWNSAAAAWKAYNDRRAVPPSAVPPRLTEARKYFEAGPGFVGGGIYLLEHLHLDLHRGVAARYHQARARFHLGETGTTMALWNRLRADVDAHLTDREAATLLDKLRKDADGPLAARLDLLSRDWLPGGPWEAWHELLRAEPSR